MNTVQTWFSKLQISTLTTGLLVGLLTLMPVLMLPLGTSPLDTTKSFLLSLTGVLLLILLALQLLKKPWLHVPLHPLLWPILALATSTIVSSALSAPFSPQIFLGMGGALVAMTAVMLFGSWLLNASATGKAPAVIAWTGAFVAVLGALDAFKVGSGLLYQLLYRLSGLTDISFVPAGSYFMLGQMCLVALVVAVVAALTTRHKKDQLSLGVAALFNILGLAIAIWYSLPGKPTTPILLPWTANWAIAADVLKTPTLALFGVGPDNFGAAFTRFKPTWLNNTPFWNVEFTQARSLPLSLLTTQGLLGLLAWAFLVFMVIKHFPTFKKVSPALTAGLVALLVLQAVFPPTLLMLSWFAIFLALIMAGSQSAFSWLAITPLTVHLLAPQETHYKTHPKYSSFIMGIIIVVILLSSGSILYSLGRNAIAQAYVFQANRAASNGNGSLLYEYQQQALNFNPYSPESHYLYSLTNLQIASLLSSQSEVSDQDREQVTALLSQSIREARIAATLAPQKAMYWENLGDIYSSLIGTTEGAATWAAEAYRQSLLLSPNQPNLYLKLGSVFYKAGNYADAVLLFNEAVKFKVDYTPAYYNAALAFKEANSLANAEAAYQQTLAALELTSGKDTEEYALVAKELEAVQQAIASSASAKVKPTPTPAAVPNSGNVASPSGQLQNAVNSSLSLTEEALQNPSAEDLTPQSQVELDDQTRQLLESNP